MLAEKQEPVGLFFDLDKQDTYIKKVFLSKNWNIF